MRPFACLYAPAGLPEPRLASLAEACLLYSSQVALRSGEAVLLETGKSRHLYGQASLGLRLQRLARRAGADCRLRFGASPAEALALARYGATDPAQLPLEALGDYASPFLHDEGAQQLALSLARPLRALGLGRLGDLLALPPQSLGSRFGPQAPILQQRVAGDWDMGWPRYEKKERPTEHWTLAEGALGGACADREQLDAALRILCERLCARLRGRNERVSRLRLELELDVFPRREPTRLPWELGLPLALGEARELHSVLRNALDAWLGQGLPGPALAAHLQALEALPGLRGQRNLFERREEALEAFNASVDRLRERLGPGQVFQAALQQRHRPEGAWRKTLQELAPRAASPAAAPAAWRPTRLLRRPLPLLRAGDELALANGRRWRALQWQGPERLQGEWWLDAPGAAAGFARDYFRVSAQASSDLWVYQELQGAQPGFWLHGFFD